MNANYGRKKKHTHKLMQLVYILYCLLQSIYRVENKK